jgi:Fe-S-cluster containining protein
MMLTEEDVRRIESLGYRNFYYQKNGFLYLKNVNGKCIFLDNNGLCRIYNHRPEGCKFYPFIYDVEKDEILRDEDCPYRNEFELENEEKLKILVLNILKEREERVKGGRQ